MRDWVPFRGNDLSHEISAKVSALMVVVIVTVAPGCINLPKRNPLPAALINEARPLGIDGIRSWGDQPSQSNDEWFALSREEVKALHPAIFGRDHNYLAISGGGANGAFGAGILVGWTAAGDRPEFTIVTGISTGALSAPFVFLGSKYDDRLQEFYTTTTTDDILNKRFLWNRFFSDAAASTKPLQRLLVRIIDEPLMQAIAKEHERGRRLLIGTTNLDAGRPVIWNIGKIADSGHPDALNLIRRVLLASASLPGAFPPVLLEVESDRGRFDEMHVDGGATAQLFLYPAGLDWERVSDKLEVPRPPRVYIIRNSRLDPRFGTVRNKLVPIAGRTISSLIRTQGIGDLYRVYLTTQRDGLEFNLAHIPDDFKATKVEQFDPVYMRKLFDVGYDLAKSGYPWEETPPALEHLPE